MKATSEGPSAGGCRNGNSPHHEVFFEERFLMSWVQLPTHPLCCIFCEEHPYFQEPFRNSRQPHPYALLHKPAPPLSEFHLVISSCGGGGGGGMLMDHVAVWPQRGESRLHNYNILGGEVGGGGGGGS